MNGPYIQAFGNLTRDPEKRYSNNNGTEYARITVAVNTVTGPGPDRRETDYFSANLYGNQMLNALNRCSKGTPVYIAGRFSHREYQRQDGTPGYDLHIETRDFRVLHRAPEGSWQEEDAYNTDNPQSLAENQQQPDAQDLDFHAPATPPEQAPEPATLG